MQKHNSAPMPASSGDSIEQETLNMLRRADSTMYRKSAFMRMGSEAAALVKRYLSSLRAGASFIPEEHILDSCSKGLKRLVLHVDLNKTILMSDAVQNADMRHVVNMLLSDCCWGRMELIGSTPHWEPVGRLATDRPYGDPELMTYRQYLDSFLLPYDDSMEPEAEKRNLQVKKRRQELKRCFTEEGQPGEMFVGVHKQLCKKLALPENEAIGKFLQGRTERHIVPSFFNLLKYLQDEDLDFTIVFRTFGSDLKEVVEEMNLFASGNHPSFPGVRMDGSDGRVDLRMSEGMSSFGAFYRDGLGVDGTKLAFGVPLDLISQEKVTIEELEKLTDGSASMAFGFHDIYRTLESYVNEPGCHALAIRDYYPFWKHHNERSHAGKLLLQDSTNDSVLHIFLDDNIGYDTAHIVDAREVQTGAPKEFHEVNNKSLLKVEPLNAILDNKYFIRTVEAAVRRVAHEASGAPTCCGELFSPTPSPPPGPTIPSKSGMSPYSAPSTSLGDLMKASTLLENRFPNRKSPRGSWSPPRTAAAGKAAPAQHKPPPGSLHERIVQRSTSLASLNVL